MSHIVSKNVEIIVNGNERYLLETGDEIVVETLDNSQKTGLAKKFGPVMDVEDYWRKLDEIKKFLRKAIGRARKEVKEGPKQSQIIKDIKEFLDEDVGDFVMSLADQKTQELINQDKIDRMSDVETKAEMQRSIDDYKKESQVKIDGLSADEWKEQNRKRKEREERIMESIDYLSSL